ncbi:hypothetical protein BDZ90DRAFT_262475 [Jaminaea rosea]|uniref:Uncharacterized protein n=1 Tax=Jaminaea rosea TaxID=1569628 RepID=A0A316UJM9_9BASI|nr:hypothetical protein BDZ90DRAFT_262475 [Jaminaea rosea]PWN25429.1 hypothetical protein BDZ90DRAFT_262475 [Jaminaea rosea]
MAPAVEEERADLVGGLLLEARAMTVREREGHKESDQAHQWPLRVQNLRLPTPKSHTHLQDKVFGWLDQREKDQRLARASQPKVELQARQTVPPSLDGSARSIDSLNLLARQGRLGLLEVNGLCCINTRPGVPPPQPLAYHSYIALPTWVSGGARDVAEQLGLDCRSDGRPMTTAMFCEEPNGQGLFDVAHPSALDREECKIGLLLRKPSNWEWVLHKRRPEGVYSPSAKAQLQLCANQRRLLEAGREALGMAPRPFVQLPYGVEPRSHFAIWPSTSKPTTRNASVGMSLSGKQLHISPLSRLARTTSSSSGADCPATAKAASWIRQKWFKARTQATMYNIWVGFRKEHEEAGYKWPTIQPPTYATTA